MNKVNLFLVEFKSVNPKWLDHIGEGRRKSASISAFPSDTEEHKMRPPFESETSRDQGLREREAGVVGDWEKNTVSDCRSSFYFCCQQTQTSCEEFGCGVGAGGLYEEWEDHWDTRRR